MSFFDRAVALPRPELSPLLEAAILSHTELVAGLLALPVKWNLSETVPAGPGRDAAIHGMGPLALLLRARNNGYWGERGHEKSRADCAALCLELVRRGASLIDESRAGSSPLAEAVSAIRTEFVQGLAGHPDFVAAKIQDLRVGRPPQGSDPDRRQCLLEYAVRRGEPQMVEALIDLAGLDPNRLFPSGALPLGSSPSFAVTSALLARGADPELADAHGNTAIALASDSAASTGERDKIIGALASALRSKNGKGKGSDPALMDQLRSENIVALLEAAENAPKSSMLKTISAFKFDPAKTRDPKTGRTPLMAALQGGKLASAKHLLSAGCSPNDESADGLRACAYALIGNNSPNGPSSLNIVELCSQAGADWCARSASGDGLVSQAIRACRSLEEFQGSVALIEKCLSSELIPAAAFASDPLTPLKMIEAFDRLSHAKDAVSWRTRGGFSILTTVLGKRKAAFAPEVADAVRDALWAHTLRVCPKTINPYDDYRGATAKLSERFPAEGEPTLFPKSSAVLDTMPPENRQCFSQAFPAQAALFERGIIEADLPAATAKRAQPKAL